MVTGGHKEGKKEGKPETVRMPVGVPVEAVEEEDHSQRWEGSMHCCGERKSDHVDYNLPLQTPIDSRIIHQV